MKPKVDRHKSTIFLKQFHVVYCIIFVTDNKAKDGSEVLLTIACQSTKEKVKMATVLKLSDKFKQSLLLGWNEA